MAIAFSLSLQHSGGSAMEQKGAEFAEAFSESLGEPVQAVVFPTYRAQLAALTAGEQEVAWLPPMLQHEAMDSGAQLVAVPLRNGWMTYRCAILVRTGAPWTSLEQVSGVRAAWRDKSSASGYLFPRLEMAAAGVKLETALASEAFFGTSLRAAQAVAANEADLCTCAVSESAATDLAKAQREVVDMLGAVGNQLRVLGITDSIPPDGFLVSARVTDRTRIANALYSMHLKPKGKEALAKLLQADRLTPVNDAILRSLQSWADTARARSV